MNDMRQMTALGRSIEDGSFAIVDREAGPHRFPDAEWQVVRRIIHATADFEFKDLMRFHPDAIEAGVAALRAGCPVLVDVKMIAAGLNEDRLVGLRVEGPLLYFRRRRDRDGPQGPELDAGDRRPCARPTG